MMLDEVEIDEELYIVLRPLIFTTRIFGFCPVSVRRVQPTRPKYLVKFSKVTCAYSIILSTFLATISAYGLAVDLKAQDSVRMNNKSVKYVTMFDLGEIVLTVFVGVLSTPFKLKHFFRTLRSFDRIDRILPMTAPEKDPRRTILLMLACLAYTMFVLIYEISVWASTSAKRGILSQMLRRYVPVYVSYFMVLVQQVPYWYLVRLIRQRIERINQYLSESVTSRTSQVESEIAHVKNVMKLYHQLTTVATDSVNDFCGINMLLIMMSILLHLIVTPYFLLVEIDNGGVIYFIILQFAWTMLHVGRLMMIVETCQSCLNSIGSSVTTFLVILFQIGRTRNDTYFSKID